MNKHLLIIDDDRLTRRSLQLHLIQSGYSCDCAATLREGMEMAHRHVPQLVLLDIGLPDIDGLEGIRSLQQQYPAIPVIFVTGRRRELDQVVGLELGADDYITKPFDIDVLLARVRAVLRRVSAPYIAPAEPVLVGDIEVDPAARTVRVAGIRVELAPREFDLLLYLAYSAGHVVGVAELLQHVWGQDWQGEEQTVYVHVRWLRTKIERNPSCPERLLTVRGKGYKLVASPLLQ
jgi:DNA-binding response OmpR family regulator